MDAVLFSIGFPGGDEMALQITCNDPQSYYKVLSAVKFATQLRDKGDDIDDVRIKLAEYMVWLGL